MPASVERRVRLRRTLAVLATLVALGMVVWLDIRTSIWQEFVILSGIAAGLVTFLLTALFAERILARSEHARWVPVTRLALTDILHNMADSNSRLSRGEVLPRGLSMPDTPAGDVDQMKLDDLLDDVLAERDELTAVLARWSAFLAASADVQDLLDHLAALTVHLDDVRDAALDVERQRGQATHATLEAAVTAYNTRIRAAISELRRLLDVLEREAPDDD